MRDGIKCFCEFHGSDFSNDAIGQTHRAFSTAAFACGSSAGNSEDARATPNV